MVLLRSIVRDEQGRDLVEYALIVAAVGLALITTVNQLSAAVDQSDEYHQGSPVSEPAGQ